jgi:hypothetical protein
VVKIRAWFSVGDVTFAGDGQKHEEIGDFVDRLTVYFGEIDAGLVRWALLIIF